MPQTTLELQEWRQYDPDSDERLRGLSFGDNNEAREIAEQLTKAGLLRVYELAQGLLIGTSSFVGSVQVGPVTLVIRPKIADLPLMNLVRYAYGLRNLRLYEPLGLSVSSMQFQDLLLHQLAAETTELLSRGLRRDYVRLFEHLDSPRGRIDFNRIAYEGGVSATRLPCQHHLRMDDCLHNRVLLAGLDFGSRLTGDPELRTRLRRLAAVLSLGVTGVRLDRQMLEKAERRSNRLTRSYRPSFEIIGMLIEGLGTLISAEGNTVTVPGFLFDMNRFFQALISRFLHESLEEYRIEDEHRIRGMIRYVPGHNPRGKRSPEPRPDIVVLKGAKTVAMLDAKYRDLWAHDLPRDMLYQLAMYALSQDTKPEAVILYPTTDPAAREARLEVRNPYGGFRGQVVLRPVDLLRLEELLSTPPSAHVSQLKSSYARQLAFGTDM